jgi:predicted O-linked N-acetylglucosamine transferase (SPINDLY family)
MDLLEEALTMHRRGAIAEAAARYAEVLRADPGNADAQYYLAVISCRDGRFAEGAEFARKALVTDPQHARAHVLLGRALSELGRNVEALVSFERAIARTPDLAQAHASRADVLSDLGRNAEAIESYDRALVLAPDVAEDWFNRGLALHAVGRYDQAIASFDRAIASKPDLVQAHRSRANMLSDLGRNAEAIEGYDRVLAIEPDAVEDWFNRGLVLHAVGRHEDAIASFDRAIAGKDDFAQAHLARARVLSDLGRYKDAFEGVDILLAIEPDLAEAWLDRGHIFYELKRYDDALAAYDRALALKPKLAAAWLGQGNVHAEVKQHDDAIPAYDRALALKPDLAEAWLGRGNVDAKFKRHDQARAAYDRAVALKPDLADAWLGRGNISFEFKQHADALAAYGRALALKPKLAEAWLGRGNVHAELKRYNDALACYEQALTLKPDLADAWVGRGIVYAELNQHSDAFAAYDHALKLNPDVEYAVGSRLHAKLQMCDWTDFDTDAAQLLSMVREGKRASVPFALLSLPSTAADQLQCAKRFMQDRAAFSPIWRGGVSSHERIRVAYLSADFRNHAVAQLTVGLFEQHDRSRFEVTGISIGPAADSALRCRLERAFEHFIDVANKTDEEIANLIQGHEIDIAIDLMGHTQNGRLGILAHRAAPIQVHYIGYAGTIGTDHLDYILADSTIIPEEHRGFYAEQVVWLPNSYLASDNRRIISPRAPTRRECGLPEDGFVFCSFNNPYKIEPKIFQLWMRLLRATPNSVLWLSESNAKAVTNLRREAQRCGISPQRLIFAPRIPENSDHLARQRLADLFLDTLPYNAHSTASDALWAGLPVLTCLGETFAGRVAASLLHAIGLPELVTTSFDDYEALALSLAHDPSRLAAIKARLARNRDTHPLFDTKRSCRHIEAAYATMWKNYVSGRAPTAFAVVDEADRSGDRRQ